MGIFSKNKYKIDKERLPKCVAFIIDGNGRWATKKSMPRMFGHKAGIEAVKTTITEAQNLGIKEVMFFCFSTENWNRPKPEVEGLFTLFREYLNKGFEQFAKSGLKFRLCGDREGLPADVRQKAEELENQTKNCDKMTVCFCINYGGRSDILQAVNKCVKNGKADVTEDEFKSYLHTAGISDPDLIVRTSGEQRISNFLLFQMAYSEFYFCKCYWPDFDKKEFEKAIYDFQQRNRRFGAIKE